jgi:hypothetical protein
VTLGRLVLELCDDVADELEPDVADDDQGDDEE